MALDVLAIISDDMERLGVNYELGEWTGEVTYPYFTGEFQDMPTTTEDGMCESQFILNGFGRGSWLDLVRAEERIERYYNRVSGRVVTTDNGSAVAIFYDSFLIVPTEDEELKRIQINLKIKEWRVI